MEKMGKTTGTGEKPAKKAGRIRGIMAVALGLPFCVFLLLCLSLCWGGMGAKAEGLETGEESSRVDQYMEIAEGIITWKKESRGTDAGGNLFESPFIENAGYEIGDWYALGIGRLGYPDIYKAYLTSTYDYVYRKYKEEGKLSEDKATEWHRISLAILAMGGDPASISQGTGEPYINMIADGTYNRGLTAPLGQQGVNGYIWGLITLDAMRYQVPEDAYETREDMIGAILSEYMPGEGFYFGGVSDVDITAMAIQALAPYYNSESAYQVEGPDGTGRLLTVRQAVDGSLEWLSGCQSDSGDFYSWDTWNVESTAQVAVALASLGIDPLKDERFIKDGNTLLDGILKYRLEDGSFSHSYAYDTDNLNSLPGQSNSMASEQVLYAMAALCRQELGLRSLYDFREEMDGELKLKIRGLEEEIASLGNSGLSASGKSPEELYGEYLEIPAGERFYVTNYWELSDCLRAQGKEALLVDGADYVGEAQSGAGHVERIFTKGSIETGLQGFTEGDMFLAMEILSRSRAGDLDQLDGLLEALAVTPNRGDYEETERKLEEKREELLQLQAKIDSLNEEIAQKFPSPADTGYGEAGEMGEVIQRCEALDEYDREQILMYQELKDRWEELNSRFSRNIYIMTILSAVAVAVCVFHEIRRPRSRLLQGARNPPNYQKTNNINIK